MEVYATYSCSSFYEKAERSLRLIIQPAQPTKLRFNEFNDPLAKEHFLTICALIRLCLVINSFEITEHVSLSLRMLD